MGQKETEAERDEGTLDATLSRQPRESPVGSSGEPNFGRFLRVTRVGVSQSKR